MNTTLNCLSWMQNQKEQSPFRIAEDIGKICNTTYTVPTTNFHESDYIPNAATSNNCTCSWSMYNLLSACSYCVGQPQYPSWKTWNASCANYPSNSYLPFGYGLSEGIPFWATQNPANWDSAVFNVAQAADIAGSDNSDVTGVASASIPGSSSTSVTAPSSTSVPVGAIAGGVVGGIVAIIIGGLLIFCAIRRRGRQRTYTSPSVFPPARGSTWNQVPTRSIPHTISPFHSTTSLAPISLASPVSLGLPSRGNGAAPVPPITDAADVITPFLTTRSRLSPSPPPSKAAEALAERTTPPPFQRARLNPPPYSAAMEPGPSEAVAPLSRRSSAKRRKRHDRGTSDVTVHSGISTGESVSTSHTESRVEHDRPRVLAPGTGAVGSMENTVNGGADGGGAVGGSHGRTTNVSDPYSHAV